MTFLNSKHTSIVKWPCVWVMQAAAVLRIVRLANLPDALQASNTHIQEKPPMMMHVPYWPSFKSAALLQYSTISRKCKQGVHT